MSEKVSSILFRFLSGEAAQWEFDDLISSPRQDELEKFRLELALIREQYPSPNGGQYCNAEGLNRIKEIAEEIRQMGE